MRKLIYEECGVFGLWAPGGDAVTTAIVGLVAIQHRGQESAGICWSKDGLHLHRGAGLVEDVFRDFAAGDIDAPAAIGHVRYSAGGPAAGDVPAPALYRALGQLALAYNGRWSTPRKSGSTWNSRVPSFQTGSDGDGGSPPARAHHHRPHRRAALGFGSQIRGPMLCWSSPPTASWRPAGPHGIRPLVVGKLPQGWVVASESCALDAVGAEPVREAEPGELISIGADGLHSLPLLPPPGARPSASLSSSTLPVPTASLPAATYTWCGGNCGILAGKPPPRPTSSWGGRTQPVPLPATPRRQDSHETGLIRNRYLAHLYRPPRTSRGGGLKPNARRVVVKGTVAGTITGCGTTSTGSAMLRSGPRSTLASPLPHRLRLQTVSTPTSHRHPHAASTKSSMGADSRSSVLLGHDGGGGRRQLLLLFPIILYRREG